MFKARFDRTSVVLAVPAAILLALASLPSRAEKAPLSQDLARCAGITTDAARLACYDALARQSARVDAAQVAAPLPAAVPGPAAAPGPVAQNLSAADAAQNFGLSPAQVHPTAAGPAAIEARLTGITLNQGDFGQTYLKLDNGEIWKTRDDVARLAVGNPVKIKRAALGSFLLLDPANLSYRVSRVK